MEVLKGTAAGVRYTVHVTGDKDGVSTRHHAIFKVGETTVMFDSGAPPVISEGDKLVVAGHMRGKNVMLASAYKNTSVGIRGDSGLWLNFASMLLFFIFGAAGLGWLLLEPVLPWLPRLDGIFSWFLAVCAAFCISWGCCCLYKWLRIREAVRLVMSN
jgi:hypothetical protein